MNILIGKKIRNLRTQKFLSQEQLADELHMSQSAYARMESGQSNSWANYIEPICIIFEIQPYELLMNGDIKSTTSASSLSEKLIDQYELRIQEKDEIIQLLKTRLNISV